MKKISNIPFISFALLLIAAGCQQREISQPEVPSNFLKASIEHRVATKSQLGRTDDGKYFAFWTDKDEIAVYVDGLGRPDKYVLSEGAGSEKGVFAGTVSGDRYVALYPYSDHVTEGIKDDVLSLELPAVQKYSPGSFGEGAFPMLAVSSGEELPFKNLCAALKVSMTGEVAVKSVSFVSHDESIAVSGPATVNTVYSDAPVLVMSEGGSQRVTLKCGSVQLSEDNPTDFYIVIPAGTYKRGFSVEVETFTGTFTRTVSSDVTFVRSQLRYIAPFRCDADGEIDPDDIPFNQIWYKTLYDDIYYPSPSGFDRSIVSNTYEGGRGVIVFDGPVTDVGKDDWAVFGGYLITEVILPNCVEKIGKAAFIDSSIDSFHIPENLMSVGEQAFYNCRRLTRIYGPHASPDEKALILEDGTMAAYALGSVEADLVIPEGVKTIAPYLFSDCYGIETVTFPPSVVSVGEQAFFSCTSLQEFKGDNESLADSRSFVNPDGKLAALAPYGLTDYVMPDEVRYFPWYVFNYISSLHSITFPELSFSSLDYYDYFYGCDNLEFFYGEGTASDNHGLIVMKNNLLAATKVLPVDYRMPSGEGVVRINDYAFSRITGAERITLPDEIQSLSGFVFSHLPGLKAIQMPAMLTYMGNDTFNDTFNLDTLYLRSYSPPEYHEYYDGSYFGHDGLVICVPEGFEDQYRASSCWSRYADFITGWHYDDLPAPDYYTSTDYSRDGEVTLIQKAKKGNGIDLVLMGDGFTDVQVADGTYASVMVKMADAFFSEEPYTTYRDLFNVYSVDVVSMTEGYDHPGQALSGWFGNGTQVGGNDARAMEYALKAVTDDRLDNTLVIVAMNSPAYGGTCYMYNPEGGDYGSGMSVAYFPVGRTDDGLAQLVHHEAGGHGFAKLDDEYAYDENGAIPQDVIDSKNALAEWGWWKNVDFTNDPAKVKWSRFLSDSRYRFDGLGVFEGGATYIKGVWRPTENSIMRYNTGGFNAPSREAIWYRLHKLAYGESWQYDYEEFVAYDAVNRKTEASAASPRRYAPERPFTPTAPPVVVEKSWREVLYGKD